MKRDEFSKLLAEYEYTEEQIADCVSGVDLLEAYLADFASPKSLETTHAEDVPAFAANLIERDLNQRRNFVSIYHYAGMIKNYALQVGVLELLDGFEIVGNLHQKIGEELGEEKQAAIFKDVALPAVGSTPLEWTQVNAIVFPRLQEAANPEAVKRILRSGLRNLSGILFAHEGALRGV